MMGRPAKPKAPGAPGAWLSSLQGAVGPDMASIVDTGVFVRSEVVGISSTIAVAV
jgi:hypothetical protein